MKRAVMPLYLVLTLSSMLPRQSIFHLMIQRYNVFGVYVFLVLCASKWSCLIFSCKYFFFPFSFSLQTDMIKPAIQGVVNVLKACTKTKTVKRVILTSSAAAVSINAQNVTGLVMDEKNWTDVEFLSSEKPPTWVIRKIHFSIIGYALWVLTSVHGPKWTNLSVQGYATSKTLAERAACKFAQENNIDLITVIPSLMSGPSLTPDIPSSVALAATLITGTEPDLKMHAIVKIGVLMVYHHFCRKWLPLKRSERHANALRFNLHCTCGGCLPCPYIFGGERICFWPLHLLCCQYQCSWTCKVPQQTIPRVQSSNGVSLQPQKYASNI